MVVFTGNDQSEHTTVHNGPIRGQYSIASFEAEFIMKCTRILDSRIAIFLECREGQWPLKSLIR